MSRLSVMGTASCATISLCGFKTPDKHLNEEYINTPDKFKEFKVKDGLTVNEFYNQILYPTAQELGRTGNYPFQLLMELIDKSMMEDKFTIVTLNAHQNMGYWPKHLKKWGFELVDKTKNNLGTMCYIYTRNRARRDI